MDINVTNNFYDFGVWNSIMLIGLLFLSLLIANILKARIKILREHLIPNAVLGGLLILIASMICRSITGEYLFNLPLFSVNNSGIAVLESLTYHCLAIGFIAMTLRPSKKEATKERSKEILNTGIATIGTYMIQGMLGIAITYIASLYISGFASGCGILLAFGYGQGTGQALNIGKNFDTALGTNVYSSIGLTIAALGFLTASIVGVIYLNYLKSKGKIDPSSKSMDNRIDMSEVQGINEAPMNESVDKLSMQVALVALSYFLAYGMMYLLGNVILGEGSSMIGTIYGFNFLFGVIAAVIVKSVIKLFKKWGIQHRDYTNSFLLKRISGFAFDLMIVSGICAIQVDLITNYVWIILLLGVVGAVVTFIYQRIVTQTLFKQYEHEQFLAFFGMLTGTASTGMILLREADPDLESPVADNLVYQNLPAIVLAIPLLIISGNMTANADNPHVTLQMLGVFVAIFVILNIALFRSRIFGKNKKK